MLHLRKGRYLARPDTGSDDLIRVQSLRALCFGRPPGTLDADAFDAICTHILIEDSASGALVCCFRLLSVANGAALLHSYSAQYYDLTALSQFPSPMVELGRFCIHPAWFDPDILRVAWGALTQWVDQAGVRILFGCASFAGDDASLHKDAFSLLHTKHRAPELWQPRAKAPEVFDFATGLRSHSPNPQRAQTGIPPLLRSYLLMGGWVSDHAVIDREMGTMHVFTGVEIDAIPPARARILRSVAR